MARNAGELRETTLNVSGGRVTGKYLCSLTKELSGGAAVMKNALAWVAEQVGASSLATQISGISNTDEFNAAYHYRMSLRNAQDSLILCRVKVTDADDYDIDDTREYEFTRDGLQDALAHVAGDFGSSALEAAIEAL